ncbi:MAG: acyl carrier protein [Candidatus Marinimicrobia bacterium]|nr:acyl carrier protein [Candidatus Neomarinimicrobiota bacterium]MCH8303900.1 acyl carrier protein [Candidatus Neomarinimicrobiota bacterium]
MSDVEKIKQIISTELEIDEAEVVDSASLIDDLGADSLSVMELMIAFDDEFGVEVPEEDYDKLLTVGDIVNYITSNK